MPGKWDFNAGGVRHSKQMKDGSWKHYVVRVQDGKQIRIGYVLGVAGHYFIYIRRRRHTRKYEFLANVEDVKMGVAKLIGEYLNYVTRRAYRD